MRSQETQCEILIMLISYMIDRYKMKDKEFTSHDIVVAVKF